MALVLADRIKVRSFTTGTSDFLLENAFSGFQGFDAVGDGNETYYGVFDAAGNWEIGRGTYTASTSTLARDSIVSSSNSGAKVNFPNGGKTVYSTLPAVVANSIVTSTTTDSFKNIAVSGQSTVTADSASDTLTLVAGVGINLTTDAGNDRITIETTGDIKGSVFADDSTLLIDAVSGIIPAANLSGALPAIDGSALINVTSQGLTYNDGGPGSIEIGVTADIFDFGDGKTIDMQNSTILVTGSTITGLEASITGDIKGSVFADDSSVIVDAVDNKIYALEIITPRLENTSTLTIASDADIIMNSSTSAYLQSSNGNFNIVAQNGSVGLSDFTGAGNISISDLDGSINLGTTGTITIQGAATSPINIGVGTSGTVTIGHGSNNIVFNGNVNFSAAIVEGLSVLGDLKGSVFADDSTMIVNGVDGSLAYYPTTAGDWSGTAPTTVGEALDRLATVVKALNGDVGA